MSGSKKNYTLSELRKLSNILTELSRSKVVMPYLERNKLKSKCLLYTIGYLFCVLTFVLTFRLYGWPPLVETVGYTGLTLLTVLFVLNAFVVAVCWIPVLGNWAEYHLATDEDYVSDTARDWIADIEDILYDVEEFKRSIKNRDVKH